MKVFDLRYDYKAECEFSGDNEDNTYLIVLKEQNTKQEWCVNEEIELYLSDVEDLIQGLEQLTATLKKEIEQKY